MVAALDLFVPKAYDVLHSQWLFMDALEPGQQCGLEVLSYFHNEEENLQQYTNYFTFKLYLQYVIKQLMPKSYLEDWAHKTSSY